MKIIPLTQRQVAIVDDEDFEYDRAALLHFGQFALLNFPAEAHLVS